MSKLIQPHGHVPLKELLVTGDELKQQLAKAETLKKINISSRERGDLIMLGIGGFSPLTGFMGSADWKSICDNYTMPSLNGLFFPIPITLSVTKEIADGLTIGEEIALVYEDEIYGILKLSEKYSIDKDYECQAIFKTTDPKHPGVKMVLDQGDINLAGDVVVLSQGEFPSEYGDLYLTPKQTRELFESKGWNKVSAFQTRNPMHRSHEYLVKIAIEVSDGVLIHSLLGKLKEGDIPADVRAEAIDKLVENYFVKDTVVQAGYPLDMRYAGPREALLHALFRQNYGCSYLIVGRDHAGVGSYYGPFDAQTIFEEIPAGSLDIKPLNIDWTFWCYKCGGMASAKTCPHTPEDRLLLSGTKLRELLSTKSDVPAEFSRPEVLEVLQEYYSKL